MRLTDLNPRWFGIAGARAGVSFDCPHCRSERLAVAFAPVIYLPGTEDLRAQGWHYAVEQVFERVWQRSGEDFESLTLTPSIDASATGHWHGFVTDGAIQ